MTVPLNQSIKTQACIGLCGWVAVDTLCATAFRLSMRQELRNLVRRDLSGRRPDREHHPRWTGLYSRDPLRTRQTLVDTRWTPVSRQRAAVLAASESLCRLALTRTSGFEINH